MGSFGQILIYSTTPKIVPKSWLNKGGIGTTFWFRTKEACLEGRETAQDLLNEENKNIKIYEESRFAPYE